MAFYQNFALRRLVFFIINEILKISFMQMLEDFVKKWLFLKFGVKGLGAKKIYTKNCMY